MRRRSPKRSTWIWTVWARLSRLRSSWASSRWTKGISDSRSSAESSTPRTSVNERRSSARSSMTCRSSARSRTWPARRVAPSPGRRSSGPFPLTSGGTWRTTSSTPSCTGGVTWNSSGTTASRKSSRSARRRSELVLEELPEDRVDLHHLLPPDRLVQLDHDPHGEQDAGAGGAPDRPNHVGARSEGAHEGPRNHRHDGDVAVEDAAEDPWIPPETGDLHAARLDLTCDVLGAHVRRHDPELREDDGPPDEHEQVDEDVEDDLPILKAAEIPGVGRRVEDRQEPVLHAVDRGHVVGEAARRRGG